MPRALKRKIEREAICQQAQANGCDKVALLSGKEFDRERGALKALAMLLSPRAGIIDSHQLMRSLQADQKEVCGLGARKTHVESIVGLTKGASGHLDKKKEVEAACVVNAAGLVAAQFLSNSDSGYGIREAKGDDLSYSSRNPLTRLFFHVPEPCGFGVLLTIDMRGAGKFGLNAMSKNFRPLTQAFALTPPATERCLMIFYLLQKVLSPVQRSFICRSLSRLS